MKAIRIYTPEGSIGHAGTTLAPIPTPFAGKRIIALDNGKPGADRLLAQLGEQLATRIGARFDTIKRKGSAATPCEDALVQSISNDADLVITGTAD